MNTYTVRPCTTNPILFVRLMGWVPSWKLSLSMGRTEQRESDDLCSVLTLWNFHSRITFRAYTPMNMSQKDSIMMPQYNFHRLLGHPNSTNLLWERKFSLYLRGFRMKLWKNPILIRERERFWETAAIYFFSKYWYLLEKGRRLKM